MNSLTRAIMPLTLALLCILPFSTSAVAQPMAGTTGTIVPDLALSNTIEPAVPQEWLMVVSATERALLDAEAPELLGYLTRVTPLAPAGFELLTFRVPAALDQRAAILELVPAPLKQRIDRNHLYEARAELPQNGVTH